MDEPVDYRDPANDRNPEAGANDGMPSIHIHSHVVNRQPAEGIQARVALEIPFNDDCRSYGLRGNRYPGSYPVEVEDGHVQVDLSAQL